MATQGRNGWVCLHRKLLDSPIFLAKNPAMAKVWLWCLLRTQWKEAVLPQGYQLLALRPGQFIYGRKEACEELRITERTFRTCMAALERWGSITVKSTNKYSIATVVNWETYQSQDIQNDQQVTSKRPASDQQVTTYNKSNKVNKENTQQPSAIPEAESREPAKPRRASKPKPPAATPDNPPIPDELSTPEFQTAWRQWHEHLGMKGKRPTVLACEMQLKRLAKQLPAVAVAMIEQSIANSYQGIFELKDRGPAGTPPQAAGDRIDAAIRRRHQREEQERATN